MAQTETKTIVVNNPMPDHIKNRKRAYSETILDPDSFSLESQIIINEKTKN